MGDLRRKVRSWNFPQFFINYYIIIIIIIIIIINAYSNYVIKV